MLKKQRRDEVQTIRAAGEPEESAHDIREFTGPAEIGPPLAGVFRDIYCDFDQYSLTPAATTTLRGIGDWLTRKPRRLLIEGIAMPDAPMSITLLWVSGQPAAQNSF